MARLAVPAAEETPHSLGLELEQQRLTHRAARIRRALAAMQQLATARSGTTPAPLRLGISDFERELARIEQRLRQLSAGAAAAAPPPRAPAVH